MDPYNVRQSSGTKCFTMSENVVKTGMRKPGGTKRAGSLEETLVNLKVRSPKIEGNEKANGFTWKSECTGNNIPEPA